MTKKKDPEVLPAERMGRPSKYRPEFCRTILEHARQGGTMESFAALCGVSKQSIYTWMKDHPDFMDASKEAEPLRDKFYEDMGKMLATGQLRRVKSEEPVLNAKGEAVLDPKTGDVLMRREYEHVHGSATAWIFLCKNILGWSDKRMIGMIPAGAEDGRRARDLTPKERMQEIEEMTKALADVALAEDDASGTG